MSTTSTALDRVDPMQAAAAMPLPIAQLPTDEQIGSMWRIATALAKSGMFKDVKQAEQAFAKMVVGRDLGLTPAQSMTGLYLVEGKPQVAAPLMGHFIRSKPGYDWEVTELDDEKCSIIFRVEGREDKTSTFTIEDAKTAGLAEKVTYKKYPRNMLFSRAMSNGVKWYVPEAMGGLPVYAEDEIERGGVDGEPGGRRSSTAPVDPKALREAVLQHLPDSLKKDAFKALSAMNELAPNSWTASKVEMVFRGKNARRARRHREGDRGATRPPRAGAASGGRGRRGGDRRRGDGRRSRREVWREVWPNGHICGRG